MELLITTSSGPLVPKPITVSDFKMTTGAANGAVLVSDAQGNASWSDAFVPPSSTVIETTISGPWTDPQPMTMTFSKIFVGDGISYIIATFSQAGSNATIATFATVDSLIPVQFRPASGTVILPYTCTDNGIFSNGVCEVDASGSVFFSSSSNGDFSGSFNVGFTTVGGITFLWTSP